MSDLALGFAVSPRDWPDRLHRFLADHGGARVRVHLLHPDEATEEHYDVLVVDDICSFLTPRFVAQVYARGRRVVGVYERSRPEGKDRLAECGIDVIVDAAADPEEFLRAVMVAAEELPTVGVATAASIEVSPRRSPGRVVVISGASGGCGVTEVAVGLAFTSMRRDLPVCLVDADPLRPAIGPRLGLPPHPNLRTVIDELEHRGAAPVPPRHRGMAVLPGGVDHAALEGVRARQVLDVLEHLTARGIHVIVDAGAQLAPGDSGLPGLGAALVEAADAVVGVTAGSPVGVIRLLRWSAGVKGLAAGAVFVAFNRSPMSPYRRGELLEEVVRSYQPAGMCFLPADPTVAEAAWRGEPATRGRFIRALRRLADRLGMERRR